MPFDFNEQPLRVYGIWPQTPFPLEVSIYGYCQMACSYCFANRNRDAFSRELNPKNSAPALFRQIDRALQDEYSPYGFFLREKYPICFSNTTDPFQRAEKDYRATEAFLAWAKTTGTPLYVQTRGNALFEEWERYAPLLVPGKDVVYLSICQTDDAIRRKQEPGALALEKRWELARRLSDHGIPVVAACNPYVKEWVPEPEEYAESAKASGCRGVWWESLHFTAAQGDALARPYRNLLLQSNPPPMYLIGDLKRWWAACDARELDFYPTPKWDAYFGHRAEHPECADPAWLGGKTLDFGLDFLALVSDTACDLDRAKVAFGWEEIENYLRLRGVPNPTLDVAPFWYPYNAAIKADAQAWRARLGKRASFYQIVRYFFNHPWECQNFIWYHPLVQALWDPAGGGNYVGTAEGDLVGVLNPAIKHHGNFTLPTEEYRQGNSVWLEVVP